MKEKMVEVKPLKDHVIHHNQYHIELKKGVKAEVPEIFIPNLKTEGVIMAGGKK